MQTEATPQPTAAAPCVRCGAAVGADALHCPRCGQPVLRQAPVRARTRPPAAGSPFSSSRPALGGATPTRHRVLAALPHRLTSSDSNGARRWGVSASVAWILFGFAAIFGAVVAIDEHDNAQMLWPAQADAPSPDTQAPRPAQEAREAQPTEAEHSAGQADTAATPAAPHSRLQAMSSAALVDLLRQQLDTVRHENAADAQRLTDGSHPHNRHAAAAPSSVSSSAVAAPSDARHAQANAAVVPRKPALSVIAKKPVPHPSVAGTRLPGPVTAPARAFARPAPLTPQSEALASTQPVASEPVRATAALPALPALPTAEAAEAAAALPARMQPPGLSAAPEPPRVAEQPLTAKTETPPAVAAPSPASSSSAAPVPLATPALAPAPGERGEEAHPRLRPGCAAGSSSAQCNEGTSPPDTNGSHAAPAGQTNEVWSGPVKPAVTPPSEHAGTAQTPAKRAAKTHAPRQRLASGGSGRTVRRASERAAQRAAERPDDHGAASSPLAMAKQTWHTVLSEIEPRERLKPARSAELSESHTAIYRGH